MTLRHKWVKVMALSSCLMLMLISGPHFVGAVEYPYSDYGYFPETGYAVTGRFLDYWEDHGGLKQQGYPISDQIQEVSDIDGKSYSVQYFERAEFESHTEFFDKDYPNLHPPTTILLSLLGSLRYTKKYPYGAPNQRPNQSQGSIFFPQTGKRLGGSFLAYWQQYGGLAQQGYPISDEIQERSETDGQIYTVQYFERSVMEWHPGNTPPNDVLLSLLGTFRYEEKYSQAIKSLGTPQLIAANNGYTIAGGHYIFYVRYDNSDPSSGDTGKWLYGYDLMQNKEFPVTHTRNEIANMATDGQHLVWSTYVRHAPDAEPQPVYSYYAGTTNTSHQIMTATMSTGHPDLSVDRGILYYADRTSGHEGLYARRLDTNQEQLISEDGDAPVAATGEVLWSSYVSGKDITTSTLHLTSLENNIPDRVITETTQFTFGTYDVWGSNVVWSYQFAIVPQNMYMYNLDDKSTTLLSMIGIGPHINGNKVVWTQGDVNAMSKYVPFHGTWVMSYVLITRLVVDTQGRWW